MKVCLDTCVLYPTVMREVLLGVAAQGLFEPIWSERILGEWSRAAAKLAPAGQVQADTEIAMVTAQWPKAKVTPPSGLLDRLWLPDANDVHVLAAAIVGHADVIVTVNAKDFPRNILAEEGLSRSDPDGFLVGFYASAPDAVSHAVSQVHAEANRLSGQEWDIRRLMKKARLPRLGKALDTDLG
ncbi:RSP_2648 family PIN domain-containing protein [Marivita sp. XM-24bin2]|uniref:RSP_2648 family PIN domain-containing protein n=1 Tax=unclassified Marivita TaxID=2632480 RepID=UPI000D79EA2A|nr:PIN domain-containing protein [Marivita sp. XM-24bin2]MCR9111058.1 PIN domain-containing protein [Paracoccaceae bacterium]PWL35980.1 MAG: PIN domain-containing protein [Marivita sp. XM-24bin2]